MCFLWTCVPIYVALLLWVVFDLFMRLVFVGLFVFEFVCGWVVIVCYSVRLLCRFAFDLVCFFFVWWLLDA